MSPQTSWPMAAASQNLYFSRRREQSGKVKRAPLQPLFFQAHAQVWRKGYNVGIKSFTKFLYTYLYIKSLKHKCPFLLTASLDFDWRRHRHGLS